MASIKIERLQGLIHKKVATVLNRDLSDPRIRLVTVTKVELTRDLSHVTVFWSTLDEGPPRRTVERALEDARGYVQREMAAILHTRTTPRLQWKFDPSVEGTERLAKILREARDEDERRARERGDTPEGEPDPPPDDQVP